MTSFETGRKAEAAAAAFLVRKGCTVVAQNWRTPRCEIDIVAERNGVVYLCEVKYRRTNTSGSGIEYITPQKLRQMQFAAQTWVHVHGWQGEYQLCAIEVSGADFVVTNVVKDIVP
ncbi:MAG TPA: YraN family protein [Candidatus Saccharimonadales bacterium]|nr:YraN family protein [Candidatus Saccharimonadales bacterium]